MNTAKTRYADTSVDLVEALRRQNRAIIILFLLVFAIPAIFSWYASRNLPIVSSVQIDNLKLVSEERLCPGELLSFSYDLKFEGNGVLSRDLTVWNIDPPKTLIFSMARRFILPADITQQSLLESWHIPTQYYSYETDATEPLPPGRYHRQIAISSTTNQEVVDIGWVEFVVLPPELCS